MSRKITTFKKPPYYKKPKSSSVFSVCTGKEAVVLYIFLMLKPLKTRSFREIETLKKICSH